MAFVLSGGPRKSGVELQLSAEPPSPVGAGVGSGTAAFYRFGMKMFLIKEWNQGF